MKRIALLMAVLLLGWGSPLAWAADEKTDTAYMEVVLKGLDGTKVSLADFKGKVVLVNYWATWCPPCREEMPLFAKVRNQYREKGFEVVGVVYMDRPEPADLTAMLGEMGVNYPIFQGPPESVIHLSESMGGVRGLPTSMLLDREGRVVQRFMGVFTERKLLQMLEPLLEGVVVPPEEEGGEKTWNKIHP